MQQCRTALNSIIRHACIPRAVFSSPKRLTTREWYYAGVRGQLHDLFDVITIQYDLCISVRSRRTCSVTTCSSYISRYNRDVCLCRALLYCRLRFAFLRRRRGNDFVWYVYGKDSPRRATSRPGKSFTLVSNCVRRHEQQPTGDLRDGSRAHRLIFPWTSWFPAHVLS